MIKKYITFSDLAKTCGVVDIDELREKYHECIDLYYEGICGEDPYSCCIHRHHKNIPDYVEIDYFVAKDLDVKSYTYKLKTEEELNSSIYQLTEAYMYKQIVTVIPNLEFKAMQQYVIDNDIRLIMTGDDDIC